MKGSDGVCLPSEYVEAVAYYEREHEVPLETSTYEKLINTLITLDSKESLNEFEQNTVELIVSILVMYNIELPIDKMWTDRIKYKYDEVKKLFKG